MINKRHQELASKMMKGAGTLVSLSNPVAGGAMKLAGHAMKPSTPKMSG